MNHQVKTTISHQSPEGLRLKGYLLDDLIGHVTFGDIVYLLMAGKLPPGHEGAIIEAMLVSCVDHGLNAPSVNSARTVASCGVPVSTAIAAGISAIGEYHGGAGEACSELLSKYLQDFPKKTIPDIAKSIAQEYLRNNRRIPGLGHRIYKEEDPRAIKLIALAKKWNLNGSAIALIEALVAAWETETGRHLPINIDGAHGAILHDMGIPSIQAKGLFIIGRTVGLNAHVVEQINLNQPFGFAAPVDTDYIGPDNCEIS